ncbi:hypothetical protein N7509_005892 [Penicillium cosmopolitanum]|uniref:UNC-45/Cro1/She4 central domain-containing protein n=1 Tax=Penicillium cosmopolitanum TaxID=1131564 RepID=A0A9W9W337_9EURO|nr:uncharacterized protein N7509_005892 [Penicillium cosmopolitanum]KAJ5397779.1 hypothetical protein N7509_005892 [Penicillium cosmopolitanum]
MVQATGEERAAHLAREAVELVDAGHREAASRNLREALSIAPENSEVKAAFLKIQQEEENDHQLLNLCRRYTTRQDDSAGKEAAAYLRTDGLKPPENVALESLKLLLAEPAHALTDMQDEIISGLVRQSVSVRQYFSTQLQISVTTFFDEIYDRGDGAAVCLDTVVLDPTVWPSESTRSHCEDELFQLFLAKLMESGHDLDGRSLKGITRLLAVDAERLQNLIDDEGFEVILTSLDNRLPLELRSQATLATAKYLEVSQDAGAKKFSALIAAMIAKGRLDDLIIAFSAVAAVFPVAPAAAASVFLSDELMNALKPLATREAKRRKVEISVLDLLNAACINRPSREAISKNFSEWLSHTLTNGSDEGSELAAVVLAKIRASETTKSEENGKILEEDSVSELVERFKGLMSESKVENISHAIEGLAYSSVKPFVKEQLANDSTFMRDLVAVLKKHTIDSSLLYGGLMVIFNLTKFLPNLSDEQQKMGQLKDYADASAGKTKAKASTPDPLDQDEAVLNRCGFVIDAGAMSLLVDCGRLSTPSIHDLTAKIVLALARVQKSRGALAQQGAVKLLLSLAIPKQGSPALATEATQNASHALARILISIDPAHVFPRPAFHKSHPPFSVDQPRDLLPVFESLLALTNLASYPHDESPAELTVREGWAAVEDLLLSSNSRVQRAACELVCNLMTCESGIVKFADGSKRAAQRLHILLALTDADDIPTRRAAGGAIAMLTEYDAAVAAVLDRQRGVDLLLGLCQEDDDSLVHRGIVCVRNLTFAASGDIGTRAKAAVRAAGGIDILTACLKATKNPAVLQAGVEALKPLVQDQK